MKYYNLARRVSLRMQKTHTHTHTLLHIFVSTISALELGCSLRVMGARYMNLRLNTNTQRIREMYGQYITLANLNGKSLEGEPHQIPSPFALVNL